MTEHALKTWPEFFADVVAGRKTFEIRLNDRNFKLGDTLRLEEWDPETRQYTSCFKRYRVTYICDSEAFVKPGHVVMSIEPIEES